MVTPSLTGEGMSLALGSARCLADSLCARVTPEVYRTRLRKAFGRQLSIARAFEALLQRERPQRPMVHSLSALPMLLRAGAGWSRGG